MQLMSLQDFAVEVDPEAEFRNTLCLLCMLHLHHLLMSFLISL